MIIVQNNCTDPAYNLALEELLFSSADDDVFMLWQNRPTVVIGRNQNALAEIDRDYAMSADIKVVRRLTGGGAVYHDMGNLNFTFIRRGAKEHFLDFSYFNRPIVELLRSRNIDAKSSGRNDILVDGKKFSGGAQTVKDEAVLHHGTLMFDVDLSVLDRVLKPHPLKLESKAVRSVRSRVVNLSSLMSDSIPEFKAEAEAMMRGSAASSRTLNAEALGLHDAALKLKKDKYDTFIWNFGEAPACTYSNAVYGSAGLIEAAVRVEGGVMTMLNLSGDFMGLYPIEELTAAITGTPFEPVAVEAALKRIDVSRYISGVSAEEILQLILMKKKEGENL